MRLLALALLLLAGCQRVLQRESITPIRVFAPLRQPWAKDSRGASTAMACVSPFRFDLDMGDRIAEALYISAVLAAAQEGETTLATPLLRPRTLENMRQSELDLWRALTGANPSGREPRTPAPLEEAPLPYDLGAVTQLAPREGFAHGVALRGVGYRFNDGEDTFRIERSSEVTDYASSAAMLQVRGREVFLLAKRCEGFGCVQIDWLELGATPFIEHMIFDERGGSGERRLLRDGTARVQQRTYRRNELGLACDLDFIERSEAGALLRPWDDPLGSPRAPHAAEVFGQGFRNGVSVTLTGSEGLPAPGATEVLAWIAESDGAIVAAGFSGYAGNTLHHYGLALPESDLTRAVITAAPGLGVAPQ